MDYVADLITITNKLIFKNILKSIKINFTKSCFHDWRTFYCKLHFLTLSDEIDKQKRELLQAKQAKETAEHQCTLEVFFLKKCLLPSRNLIQDLCIFNIYVKMSFIVRHNYLLNSFRHSCILSTDLFFSLWVSSRTRTKWESWVLKKQAPCGGERAREHQRTFN